MNKLMKLIATFAIFITSIFNVPTALAEEPEEINPEENVVHVTEEESDTDWDTFLFTSNAFPDEMFGGIEMFSTLTKSHRVAKFYCNNAYGYGYVTFLILDGEPVFCLEPTAIINWDSDYYETTAWWDLSWEQQQKIWQYAYYGYAYPGHQNDRYYLASQLMIWTVVDKWYDPYTPDGGNYYDVSAEIDEINRLISTAGSTPSFNGQTVDLAYGLPVTITDNNNSLNNYSISSTAGITASKNGNKLTFTLNSEEYASSVSYSPSSSGGYGTPIVYKASGSQTVMKVRPYDPLKPFSLKFNWGTGDVQIIKTDEDGKAVADVEFMISTDEFFENVIGTYKTDSTGVINIKGLKARTYYVKEIAAPERYLIDTDTKQLDVYPNKVNKLNVEDEFVRGKVTIKKSDSETGKLISGAIFGLYNEQNERLQELVIQANGEATSDYIRFGKYYVKEEIAPTGYVVDTETKHWFNIKTHDEIVEIKATNVPQKGQIIISKLDKETGSTAQGDASLEGVTWAVFADADIVDQEGTVHYTKDELVETFTSDSVTGTSSLLPLGKYRVEELAAGEGYLVSDEVIHVELTAQQQTVKVDIQNFTYENQVIKGNFEITKYVDAKVNLARQSSAVQLPGKGFTFDVYLKSNNTLVDTITTDENGQATSRMLPYGTYLLVERPAEGYQKIDDIEVIIAENNKTLHYVVENSVIRSELTLFKVDSETGKVIPAAGVSFKLRNEDGEFVTQTITYPQKVETDTFTTDETGSVHFPETLVYGTYYLTEINAPYGYVLADEDIEIIVDGSSKQIYLNVENDAAKGRIMIEKKGELFAGYDEETTDFGTLYTPRFEIGYLKGVKFQIIAREDIIGEEGTFHYHAGDVVEQLITVDDGAISSSELPLGAYSLVETETPLGYVLDETVYDFDLVYEDQHTPIVISTLSLFNERQKVELEVQKQLELVDGDSELFSEVLFGIYTSEETTIPKDSLVGFIEFNEDGTNKYSPEILPGNYYIKEIVTATGYVLNEEKFPFTVEHFETESACVRLKITEKAILNEIFRSDIVVFKVSANDGELLIKDAVFAVDDKTNGISLGQYVSGEKEKGRIIVEDIPYGTEVEIKEIFAPFGYVLSEEIFEVKVDGERETIYYAIENELAKGQLCIDKMGELLTGYASSETEYGTLYRAVYETGHLAGVKFNIIAREDIVDVEGYTHYFAGELVEELVTVEGSSTYSSELPLGAYSLVEVETPFGYVLNETVYDFDLVYEDCNTSVVLSELEIFNNRQEIDLVVSKVLEAVEEESELFSSVVFGIYTDNESLIPADSLVGLIEFNADGSIKEIPELPAGNYYLKELKTATGYVLSDEIYPFTIEHTDTQSPILTVEVTEDGKIENALERVDIEILKVNKNDHSVLLDGAVFEVFDKTHDVSLGTFKSGEDGKGRILIENIAYGTQLEIKEISAPAGYNLCTSSLTFTVETVEDITIEFENSKIIIPEMGIDH
ncbi:MAG: hypothetical protein E7192_01825 [Erysipelotrichaceae bacterium]|nr:hypothetical protein [Erysipelotrichaceae bacterium]